MSPQASQIKAPDDVLAFALAGNARLTLVSKKTGARFTYRIRHPKSDGPHFVSLLTGADNESDFQYMGCIFPGNVFRTTAKTRMGDDAPSVRAFTWAWAAITRGSLPESLEVWHEGRCGCCGRALTVPESIASGLGPVCTAKAA
jgi:hypothetical protein